MDDGGNTLQNFPELFAPVFNGNGTVTVQGTLSTTPATDFVIDFYSNTAADPSDYGEGENYLGAVLVLTDGNGFASFTFTSPGAVAPSQKITATAMDFFGNTSEFSCYAGKCATGTLAEALARGPQALCPAPIIVTVDTNEDDANPADGVCDVDLNTPGLQCSLRAAIQEANLRQGFDLIQFDIPGPGLHTIIIPIAQQLPDITEAVDIDAQTQPGYVDSPLIEVRGEVSGTTIPAVGLRVRSSKINIRGVAINHFGIDISIGDQNSSTRADNNIVSLLHHRNER